MVSFEIQKLEEKIRKRLGRFVAPRSMRLNSGLCNVLDELRKKEYPAFLCGGTIRDMVLCDSKIPRDLDIILGYISNDKIESLFSTYVRGKTGLGGIKLQIKDWSVDIWPLKNTWAFRDGKLSGDGFSDYPKITFLNIDAIAVQLFSRKGKKRIIYSNGFFEAILTKTIDINFEENPAPAKCIVRALHIANKFKYVLGPKLAHYIISYAKQMEIEELAKIYRHRYTNEHVTVDKLYNCMKNIETQLKSSNKSPVNVFFEQGSNYIDKQVNLSKINRDLFAMT